MLAEIYHKVRNVKEDELTGDFFGIMQYLPFQRGFKQILTACVKSEEKEVAELLETISGEDFNYEFWKKSDSRRIEIDMYVQTPQVGIGIEVKYQSSLSGENQLEKEAETIRSEWCRKGEKLLLLIADESSAKQLYLDNYRKRVFREVHFGYLTWQDILLCLDEIETRSVFEEKMIDDLKMLLRKRGFETFEGFEFSTPQIREDRKVNPGQNIHNAFAVVFETLQGIEKLISKCGAELDHRKYYMPIQKFLRYRSDLCWEGWIYWSFILLFQRREDGPVMENEWIDGPIYAVEINVDSETCESPEVYIAKMEFGSLKDWTKGCSPSNHNLFYDAIHANGPYEKEPLFNGIVQVKPQPGEEQKAADAFWGFQGLIWKRYHLVRITQENYKDIIFGTMEELSRTSI